MKNQSVSTVSHAWLESGVESRSRQITYFPSPSDTEPSAAAAPPTNVSTCQEPRVRAGTVATDGSHRYTHQHTPTLCLSVCLSVSRIFLDGMCMHRLFSDCLIT